jgi:peptidoglycan hydrolase-like protein with peptidoglycan-binding domain
MACLLRAALVASVVALAASFEPAQADAQSAGNVGTAALQVALRAQGLYPGTVDGIAGPATAAGVRTVERRAGLAVDGIAGPRVRRALGRLGRHPLASRALRLGCVGWDVSALQFRLAWRGFPSRVFDGVFGGHVQAAVSGYQRFAGLPADGVAGPATLRSLSRRPIPRSPLRLARPVPARVGDGFGPRGARFHTGLDLLAGYGTAARAAGTGVVSFAGWVAGYGKLVVVQHSLGVSTLYAHLARIVVRPPEHVAAGDTLGRVGMTGHATGPHLHFEVRLRGAAVDPLTALG